VDVGPVPGFSGGQVVTVFRSRRRAGSDETYARTAAAMLASARDVPGFVDFATFTGDHGDRVSIVTFATPEAQAAWRDDHSHREAQVQGRDEFYEWYSVQVATCTGATVWERPGG
jgi:heme-degrading monooxygenase HmoA